jgi:hypothetical protein
MDEASALIAVAEIAVAVAGFSGVAAAFGERNDRAFWTPSQRARFLDMLTHSGIALFASLIPLVFMFRDGSSDGWALSSLIWGVMACIGTAQGFRRGFRLPRPMGLERYVGPAVLIAFAGLVILQGYNVFVAEAFWPYLAALVGNLGFAFVQFMRMIVPRSERTPARED